MYVIHWNHDKYIIEKFRINVNILHTIYDKEYDGYDGWLVGDGTSVIGSIEVPSFGVGVGVVVIGNDDGGWRIGYDCGIGDCCGACFVFMYLERSSLVFYIIHYNKNE